MATAAEIGVSASNYTGNAALGGGTLGVAQIDTRPLEQLAHYTVMYNQAEYRQRQADAEKAAKEIADISSYDLTTSIQKDAKLIKEEWDKLVNYARDNPDAVEYKSEKWLEYQRMRGDFENKLKGAKTRDTMNLVREKEIAEALDADVKNELRRRLDLEIEATDLMTPLKHTSKADVTPVAYTAAPTKTISVTEIGRNFYSDTDYILPDMRLLKGKAMAAVNGLNEIIESRSLSEEHQNAFRLQLAAGKLEPVTTANNFTVALRKFVSDEKYRDGDNIKWDDIKRDGGILMASVIEQAERYNQNMDFMVSGIKNGHFRDNNGNELKFGINDISESDYQKINIADGLTPEEYATLRIFGQTQTMSKKTSVKQSNLGIRSQELGERIRHNKAMEGNAAERNKIARANLQFRIDEANSDEEKDAVLDDYIPRIIANQKELFVSSPKGAGKVDLRLNVNTSSPIFTVSGGGVEILKPKGKSKPIYDKYTTKVENGKNVRVPASGAKIVGYEGGHYDMDYLNAATGKPIDVGEEFKKFKKQNKEFSNMPLIDYIKENVTYGIFDVKIIGAGGSATKEDVKSALRIITNKNTKKGQTGVYEPYTADDDLDSDTEAIIDNANNEEEDN